MGMEVLMNQNRRNHALAMTLGVALVTSLAFTQARDGLPVKAFQDTHVGYALKGADDMTLYIYTKDTKGVSNCNGQCAVNWPPLLAKDGMKFADDGIGGEFSAIKRADGAMQVAYEGWPLYYWIKDKKPGDVSGQAVGGVWWVANVKPTMAVKDGLLTGANGMTLYTFDKDTAGVSACEGQCLINWPALTVAEQGDITVPAGASGKFGTIKRSSGDFQVTYNGLPLYYWVKDAKPGDTTGDKVGGVWHIVKF
jgi:predicted lipoprotein with Yx(FWY)xxD motif